MSLKRSCLPLLLGLSLLGLPLLTRADADDSSFVWDVGIDASFDNNVGRAQFEADRASEFIASAALGLSYDFDLGLFHGLSLRAFAETEEHQTIKGLARQSAGGELVYRYQHKLGFFEPFVELSAHLQQDYFGDERRNADLISYKAQYTQRLTDRITTTLGYEYKDNNSDGTVYDTSSKRLFLNMDYRMEQDWVAYMTVGYMRGQTVSSAQTSYCDGSANVDILPLLSVSQAKEMDRAFNESLCGSWLAYRVETNSKIGQLGLNKAITHDTAMDLSVLWVGSVALGDAAVDYQRRIVRISLLARF